MCVHGTGVFIGLGLSGVIPAMHYVITNGFHDAIYEAALGWLSLMAILYIIGAVIYAARIPERIWPGRFDIWVLNPSYLLYKFTFYLCTGMALLTFIKLIRLGTEYRELLSGFGCSFSYLVIPQFKFVVI